MNNINENIDFIDFTAEIAIYDDLKSIPRIIKIKPNTTNEYIEDIASTTYREAKLLGGQLPYTSIREVTENFIHANFLEIVVSILDSGNTIRFADQGPGFSDIENAKLPGFTSATQEMKKYIRGVGSGLPTVNEYLQFSNGILKIENNINRGSVVTISLESNIKDSVAFSKNDITNITNNIKLQVINKISKLSDKEINILSLLQKNGPLRLTDISNNLNHPMSSIHKDCNKLETEGYISKLSNKKRMLTADGLKILEFI